MPSPDGTYCDTLKSFSVAKTMASPSLCVGSVYDTFEGLHTPYEKNNAMNVADPVIAPKFLGFFITVRNTRTDEQFMHGEPVDTLSDWYLHFRDRPIFACIDNEQRVAYPALTRPSYGDVPWTRTRFHYAGNMAWDIIVTLALNAVPAIDRDIVNMIVISPPVPNSLDAHTAICTTSFDKTTCAIRNMCIHHAHMALGFSRADDDVLAASPAKTARSGVMVHGEDKQNGPRNSVMAHLYGSFTSFKPETSAGSTILPQILKQVSFILPCIQDGDEDCEYTILQPHKFAYIVQVKHVGGGWTVLASVNLVASAKAMLRMFNAGAEARDPRRGGSSMLNEALKSESSDCTLARMYNARLLSRYINDAYVEAAAGISLRLSKLVDESIDIDDAVIAELKPLPSLWTLFNAFAGTKMFEGQLKELGAGAVYADEVKRGNAFIELYQRSCLEPAAHSLRTTDIVVFSKTMFDICMGIATVLVNSKAVHAGDALEPTLTLKASAWRKDDNDIDSEKILTFLQQSCRGTAPKTWFASACPHFIKNPLLLVQTLLTKTSAFSAYMPGSLGNSCGDISKYIIDSMFVIDKTIAVARHSQKFIQGLALFIFKTAAQGGFHESDDVVVNRIKELHKHIQDVSKLKAAVDAAQKKKTSPEVAADVYKRYADISARVGSMDKLYTSFVDSHEDSHIAAYTAQILESAATEIEADVGALLAMIDSAPHSNHENLANAAAYTRAATEEGAVLDIAISSREPTIAAATAVKAVCDGQITSYTAQIERCAKTIEAGEKGDATAIAKQKAAVDAAKADKTDYAKKVKKLTQNIAAVTTQIDALTTLQDTDAKRKELIAATIAHNSRIISGGVGTPMVWPC
jgi:hypothetical protein